MNPPVDDITGPWWEATRERVLLLQWCASCDRVQHYPRALCLSCGGLTLGWRVATGRGTLDSYTVVHRSPSATVEPGYVVARVRLVEGPILLTHLERCAQPRCDLPVRLAWRHLDDGRNLPIFVPDSDPQE